VSEKASEGVEGGADQSGATVRRAVKGAAWLSLHQLLLSALSLPAVGYIIHRLGAEQYGNWMTAASLLTVAMIVTNLGLRSSFVRRLSADPACAPEALADQLGLRLTLSLLASALVLGACWLLGYPSIVLTCGVIGAAGLVLTTAATTLADVLQAMQRVKTLAIVGVIAGLLLTGLSVIAAWRGGGAIEIAATYLIGPLASVLILGAIVARCVCKVRIGWNLPRFKALLIGSRHLAVQQVLFAGSGHAEALLSPRLLGMGQFGVLTAGALLATRASVLPDALCTSAFPTLARAANPGAHGAAGLVQRYLLVAATGGTLVALAVTLLAGPIGRILLPSQPETVAMVIRITIWSLPLAAVELVMGYSLLAAGKESVQTRLAVWSASLGLLGSVVLISTMGLTGACWSMVLRPTLRGAVLVPVLLRTFAASAPMSVAAIPIAEPHTPHRKAG
jgi:O-antigen/teichoic acid export membrane protein